eukprot:Gb_23001 [translate_table: standard]
MATWSYWVTEVVEDHLDHYAKEWEQFTIENGEGQLCQKYMWLLQSGIVHYAEAPVLYLPYLIIVEMLSRFENGAFCSPPCFSQASSPPFLNASHCLHKRVREVAHGLHDLWLFTSYDFSLDSSTSGDPSPSSDYSTYSDGPTFDNPSTSSDCSTSGDCSTFGVCSTSNGHSTFSGLLPNDCSYLDDRSTSGLPTHGDKIEPKEEVSHQWAAIASKVANGIVYAWASWLANKLKEHCTTSQMFGHPFPMPSLVAVICMEHLGPPGWIEPESQPRLNLYSRLQRKRGDNKDRKQQKELQWTEDDKMTYGSLIVAHAPDDKNPVPTWPRLGLTEQIIWGLREKCLPKSSSRAQRILVIDHPLTSPMAQYDYWANNSAHFIEDPFRMAWSPLG